MALRSSHVLAIASVCVLAFFSCTDRSYSASSETALRFHQSHFFLGKCDITIAKNAFRLDNADNFKFIAIAKAPDWTVTLYRNDDKTYFSESLNELLDTGILSEFLVVRKARFVNPRRYKKFDISFCGQKTVCITGADETLKYIPLERMGEAPAQIEQIIYGIYKLPTGGGLPISYNAAARRKDFFVGGSHPGAPQIYLDTTKIETVQVKPAFFSLPKDYKQAVSMRAVVSGTAAVEQSEAALKTFCGDIERPKGK